MQNSSDRWIKPLTLSGQHVTLEPLEVEHAAALADAARDGMLWKLWFTTVPSPEQSDEYVYKAVAARENGGALAFVVRDNRSAKLIGSTRYCNVDETNQRLEIGYTWYAKQAQRTAVNTECKFLLLRHAFEQLGAIAVEFRTHWHNHRSRDAILRLGAKQDGVLRHHQQTADGAFRDTVVFSIIGPEWPAVKKSLLFKLETPGSSS
jgi:RimJ/RimL family protein N-acetyltransferase